MSGLYTGRKIAIFSDVHGVFEPLEAIVNDIIIRGITEIYSLGDNIGVGPSPCDVIDLIEYYNIRSVSGNAEEYCNVGVSPYLLSFDTDKFLNHEWTCARLGDYRLEFIKNMYHSYDLDIGGKKIALCHFANDIRTDYNLYDTKYYLSNYNLGVGYKQFLYTNSFEHYETIRKNIEKYGVDNPKMKGYVSARDYPIFDGKMVTSYDSIIQGHMHRNMYELGENVEFYTIRAVGVHYDEDPNDMAFYVILHEKSNNMGFDMEKVYVPYNRCKLEKTIMSSDEPTGRIKRYIRMRG